MSGKDKGGFGRVLKRALLVLLVLGVVLGAVGWYKFFREEPQPAWVSATPEMRFKYGSIGAENEAGIPYWIFLVLPRMFPEYLPGPGGYASLGVPWEQGQELPVGFTKKVVGFPRVANNCAVCHTASYRTRADENPTFVVAGPSHTTNVEGFFKFYIDCAKDPRFNADNLLYEIANEVKLSWLDVLLYRFIIIPITKKRLVEREAQFAWIYREDFPDWGRGRDDAMNLTKYFMIEEPMDDTFGPTDMPSVWNLKKYDPEPMTMNWDGATHDAYSVVLDSALGLLGAPPKDTTEFLDQARWLTDYLSALPPPRYPFPIDEGMSERGRQVFAANCARCHASERTGRPVPVEEVGTSPARLGTWNKEAAIAANQVVAQMGIERKGMVEETLVGYIAVHLDGVWLRAPYLHNGSVPTLRDLLSPVANRPTLFYRGYDLYDSVDVGFVSAGTQAEQRGTRFDTSSLGAGNEGHTFGTELPPADKEALLEYLKTL